MIGVSLMWFLIVCFAGTIGYSSARSSRKKRELQKRYTTDFLEGLGKRLKGPIKILCECATCDERFFPYICGDSIRAMAEVEVDHSVKCRGTIVEVPYRIEETTERFRERQLRI